MQFLFKASDSVQAITTVSAESVSEQEYGSHRRKGKRGFIEFYFDSTEKLSKAIEILEAQPILDPEFDFYAMPGSPSFNGTNAPTKLPLRMLREGDDDAFTKSVDEYMSFTSSDTRQNLQRLLDIAMKHKNLLVISVTVVLPDTYSTHMYDFYYRDVAWVPELSPEEVFGPPQNK